MGLYEVLFWIGRILLGGFFFMMGINHFINAKSMIPYAQAKGVPAPSLAVYVTGLLLLLGGLSVIVGTYVTIGLWLLVIFLVPTTFIMHRFWQEEDPNARMAEQVNFMKNLALLGAVLMLLYFWR